MRGAGAAGSSSAELSASCSRCGRHRSLTAAPLRPAHSRRCPSQPPPQMESLELNSDEEKALVDGIFSSAMDSLSGTVCCPLLCPASRHARLPRRMPPADRRLARHALPAAAEEDRRLPQVAGALPMLRRGIGVHHSGARARAAGLFAAPVPRALSFNTQRLTHLPACSHPACPLLIPPPAGLLPILKEAIELLFGEGLVKVRRRGEGGAGRSTGLAAPLFPAGPLRRPDSLRPPYLPAAPHRCWWPPRPSPPASTCPPRRCVVMCGTGEAVSLAG